MHLIMTTPLQFSGMYSCDGWGAINIQPDMAQQTRTTLWLHVTAYTWGLLS